MRAMRALRFGSYSISETLPGIPNLFRLKSILRYCCLWPPPRWRDVRWPWLLRPPVRFFGSSSDFSGVARVISSNPETERNRVPGVIGRNCLMLISALEHGDRVAILERDDRLLPPRGRAAGATASDPVAPHLHGADIRHGDPEQLLERIPDLVLVGLRMHLESVLPPRLIGGRALLGHHRSHDDLMEGGHHLLPFFFFGAGFAFFAAFDAAFPALRLEAGLAGLAFFAALAADFLAAFAALALFAFALAAGRFRCAAGLAFGASSASSGNGSGVTPV